MDTRPLAPGTILKNRYRVTRLVAGGGMAWVYEVQETRADKQCPRWALKELRSDQDSPEDLREARQLFEQEANILVRLAHTNLPRVVAYFEEDGRSYLVMEFVGGESLEKRLERANAPLLESQVLDWAIQVCDVLEYLHTRPTPVIFRDLKPSNIMVTPQGDIKLIDFGIARTYKAGQRRDTVTMGSENYAAPEQWGQSQTDARSDIYGLGATMYHLLTNAPPLPAFVPSSRVPVRAQNPALSERTAAVVDRAMAHDRAARYGSAAEMQQALLAALPRRQRRRVEQRLAQRRAVCTVPSTAPSAQALARRVPAPKGVGPTVVELARTCAACGEVNRPSAVYCRQCGELLAAPRPAALRLSRPAAADWEFTLQRRITLLGRRGGALPVDVDLSPFDPHGYISRNHARITWYRGRHHAIDLDSANGTYVNEHRLVPHRPQLLCPGDCIRLGRVELLFGRL